MNKALKKVLDECFWNDYQIDEQKAQHLLDSEDEGFISFILMRIISDSIFPSARIYALFSREQQEKYLPVRSSSDRIQQRINLVRAVLLDEPMKNQYKVRQWK
ncbi:MAG: hypothetical protein KAU17_02460 [Spirochaetales bacterium]|jgi:uncharacterized protein (DUF1810 family)|nr:hypothetical protein [Spirochaetales bacterium]